LISASTCAAGAPSWSAVALPAEEAAGEAAGEAAAEADEPGAGDLADMDADGAALVWCALTAVRPGGTVTTTGAAATAIAAGLLAQGLVPAASHPAAVLRELVTLPADEGPEENTPRAR
jgi:hypothetical protein